MQSPSPQPTPKRRPRSANARKLRLRKRVLDTAHRLHAKQAALQDNIDILKRHIAEESEKEREIDAELRATEQECTAAEKRTAVLVRDLASVSSASREMQQLIRNLETEALVADAERDVLAAELSSLRSRRADALRNSERLSKELERKGIQRVERSKAARLKEEELADLESQLQAARTSIADASSAYEDAAISLNRAKNGQVVELEESRIARGRLKLVRNAGATLRAALEESEKACLLAEREHAEAEKQREIAINELDALKLSIKGTTSDIEGLQSKMQAATERLRDLEARNQAMQSESAALDETLVELGRKMESAQKRYDEVKFTRDRLTEHLEEVRRVWSVADEERRRLRTLIEVTGSHFAPVEEIPPTMATSNGNQNRGGLEEAIKKLEQLKLSNTRLAEILSTHAYSNSDDSVGGTEVGRPIKKLGGTDPSVEALKREIALVRKRILELQARPKENDGERWETRSPPRSRLATAIEPLSKRGATFEPMPRRDMAILAELDVPLMD